jgi:hypothetical protein
MTETLNTPVGLHHLHGRTDRVECAGDLCSKGLGTLILRICHRSDPFAYLAVLGTASERAGIHDLNRPPDRGVDAWRVEDDAASVQTALSASSDDPQIVPHDRGPCSQTDRRHMGWPTAIANRRGAANRERVVATSLQTYGPPKRSPSVFLRTSVRHRRL